MIRIMLRSDFGEVTRSLLARGKIKVFGRKLASNLSHPIKCIYLCKIYLQQLFYPCVCYLISSVEWRHVRDMSVSKSSKAPFLSASFHTPCDVELTWKLKVVWCFSSS